jgi:hypothetical protein
MLEFCEGKLAGWKRGSDGRRSDAAVPDEGWRVVGRGRMRRFGDGMLMPCILGDSGEEVVGGIMCLLSAGRGDIRWRRVKESVQWQAALGGGVCRGPFVSRTWRRTDGAFARGWWEALGSYIVRGFTFPLSGKDCGSARPQTDEREASGS